MACIGDMMNRYESLVWKHGDKLPLGDLVIDDRIVLEVLKIRLEVVELIHVVHIRHSPAALEARNLLTAKEQLGFQKEIFHMKLRKVSVLTV